MRKRIIKFFSNPPLLNQKIFFFLKGLGKEQKKFFSTGGAIFSCEVMLTYKVTSVSLVKIFLVVQSIHYKLVKVKFGISLVYALILWQYQHLGKTFGLIAKMK